MSRTCTAAFFDLDGTLVALPSLEWRFAVFLIRNRAIGVGPCMRWVSSSARNLALGKVTEVEHNKSYLAGVETAWLEPWAEQQDAAGWPLLLQGMECLARHAAAGHSIFLISGTLEPLARAFACRVKDSTTVRAIPLEERDGAWTGRVSGATASWPGKASALENLADQFGIDLARSFAYGDRMVDLEMLERVGNPFAVNPSLSLRRAARRRAWPVLAWREEHLNESRGAQTCIQWEESAPRGLRSMK